MRLVKLTSEDIPTIQTLAKEIWEEHYTSILGTEQIDYMLELFYSTEKIQKELDEDIHWEVLYIENEPIAYLACEIKEEKIHLSKLYLKEKFRGKGIGKFLISRAKEIAQNNNKRLIYLNVNKKNLSSISFYKSTGFKKVAEGIFDIGNGYVMDDFIFELKIKKNRI